MACGGCDYCHAERLRPKGTVVGAAARKPGHPRACGNDNPVLIAESKAVHDMCKVRLACALDEGEEVLTRCLVSFKRASSPFRLDQDGR